MRGLVQYGLITEDPIFAAVLSSLFNRRGKYFPIISLPRMTRDDWQLEVYKRVVSLSRIPLKIVFCKDEDYGLLAPLRSSGLKVDLIPLEYCDYIFKFIEYDCPVDTLQIKKDDYLISLYEAMLTNKRLKITDSSSIHKKVHLLSEIKSETVVVIEKTNTITDVTSINYAAANGYDIRLIEPISENIQKRIKKIFLKLTDHKNTFEECNKEISSIIAQIYDFKEIEDSYKKAQFIVSEIPIGMSINSIPVVHMFHLQSELRLLDEYFYLEKQKKEAPICSPSFLFVDIQSDDLISEVPEISQDLDKYKVWRYNLNGKYANTANFKIYNRYFPFDLIMVSGHGTSPNCREVIYRFKSRDNKSHTVKLLEYYQFGRVVDDKVEVLTKEYFLEFDGINWEDKKALAENGILHIAREYFDVRDEVELVEYKEVNPRSIEGLLLHDGVFIGGISNFSLGNNPVVIFNTCASMVELGNLVSFAGARCLLGTMWSVYDKSARQFAKRLFQLLPTHSLADSFFQARQSIRDNYSKLAYVNFGTLNSYLPIQKHIEDQEEALKYMADRLTSSLSEATHHFVNGYLSKLDFKTLIYMQSVSEKFVNINLPTDIDLRKRLKYIANKLDSKKSIDNSNDFRLD